MKCKAKDCKECVHFINIRTHPLFRDFVIKDEGNKIVDFEGCIFHLQTLFLRQIWVRNVGLQSSVESTRNVLSKDINILNSSLSRTANAMESAISMKKQEKLADGTSTG